MSISRDDVRHGKPHPEPYLRASALLVVRPERCIVTEDSPLGAAAGLAAGMTVIGWPQSRSDGEDFPSGTILSAPVHLDEVLCLAFRTK